MTTLKGNFSGSRESDIPSQLKFKPGSVVPVQILSGTPGASLGKFLSNLSTALGGVTLDVAPLPTADQATKGHKVKTHRPG